MHDSRFYDVYDVCDMLGGVSKAYAYKVIKKLNSELTEKGYLTVSGKVSRKYFDERYYENSEYGV